MCGFREPGYLWKLDAPFVWGPIGGTQNFPIRLITEARPLEATGEILRTTLNWLQLRLSPRVHQAARAAKLLLVANRTIQRQFERAVGCDTEVMCEIGAKNIVPHQRRTRTHAALRLLWSGECHTRKGLSLLLKAIASLPPDVPVELRVLGDGPRRKNRQRLAQRLGITDRIHWLGWLPHGEALSHYAWADLFVFTSLRDTTGTVVLEALSHGVPVLAGNHQGVGDIVTAESGIKVEVTTPHNMIRAYRDAIIRIARDHELHARLSQGAARRAADYLWPRQGERIRDYYQSVLGGDFLWNDRSGAYEQLDNAAANHEPQEVCS
jgi:glycosyltransferase involved in cell wall biosynthesis